MFACSHEAAALGVVREQPIAEVKGLAAGGAGVTVLPHDPEADRAALAWWAEHCEQFSPLVGIDDAPQPDSLLLDITATARLFGGEAALTKGAVDRFARRRLRVRAAVADTPAGAWAVAHFHGAFLLERSPIHLVPPGETPGALRLLPIESLRLPERIVALLHELGIDLAGRLAALPREELSSRFGPELLRQWDRATGVQPEPIRAVRRRSEFTAAWEAEQPVRRRDMIEAAMEQAVERLVADLLAAGRGATRVECRFDCLPGGRHGAEDAFRTPCNGARPGQQAENAKGASCRSRRLTIGLFRPTVDVQHLLGLLHLQLEREPLPGPVAAVEVAALETGPLVHRQIPLFAAGRNELLGGEVLAQLIERLGSRLGRRAVLSPRLMSDAQPERAWRGEPFVGGPRRQRARKPIPGEPPPRPLLVFSQPVALGAMLAATRPDDAERLLAHPRPGEHDPVAWGRIRFEGEEHCVLGSWGPERIETGWWRGRPIARDYYRVETAAGRRLWLFHRLDTGRWFVHGAFD